jgi:acetyltransferase-like isoleucine patch superfamily enzyme
MPLLSAIRSLLSQLQDEKRAKYRRRVPLGDLLTDRWEIARQYGFGEGSSCYDSVLILGDVKVGKNTWIGPNVVLDGTGGLEIGDWCSIDAGGQIYTHDGVRRATTLGREFTHPAAPTKIGSGVFIGPNAIVSMGVTIGDRAVIGALSLVNADIPAGMKAFGQPATVRGPVES